MRVLIVDDEPEVRDVLVRALEREGHRTLTAGSLEEATSQLHAPDLDLVVLDLGLPDGSGVTLCRSLRSTRPALPILVLTARSEVSQRVEALDAGADDFLAKPFAIAELRARVRALGRRASAARASSPPPRMFADAVIDLATRSAHRGGDVVTLSTREWAILDALSAREGRVVSRSTILEDVWGEVTDGGAASLEVLVSRIRRKLGDDVVRTVRGEGYALGSDR